MRKGFELCIKGGTVYQSCGPVSQTLSDPLLTDLTLGCNKFVIVTQIVMNCIFTECFLHKGRI